MSVWRLFNFVAMTAWLFNALCVATAWWHGVPLSGFVALAAICGMVVGAMWCAEDVWPSLNGSPRQ
ncbi:hypothetical protein SQ03_05650 [Methylobacterium platani JCM 14648]|uniref:Uncharacterized protein n=1 Tax=Methylobacterium platani JCM 14648 TaxID=1295136 RepID=A0ABR5H7I4_9HYPH|nr:hypothetical protein SQ03_05650 [Methylobacterium platani JCM 14648]